MPELLGAGDGFARVRIRSLSTELNIPLGWAGIEMVGGGIFFPPSDATSYILVSPIEQSDFSSFKAGAEQSFRKELPAGNAQANVRIFDLPDGGFVVDIERIVVPSGAEHSAWKAFLPHPRRSGFVMSVILNCRYQDRARGWELLAKDVLRDLRIDWSRL